ncbi:arginase [Thermogemmatispora sp.]|uniref:arginase n=1 Tax=Thermogemmatispora sp. TaxID=1968838 RepID=UPI0035E44423
MQIRVIGVPMDLGADRRGVDIGVSAIRYAGLHEKLRALGHSVNDIGNLHVPLPESQPAGDPHVKYLEPIIQVAEELAAAVSEALEAGDLPLVLGGDHSIALGSITGVSSFYGEIGVIWIDAHGDFNTPETTPSGNIHGMVLAALAGLGHERLVQLAGRAPKVNPRNIAIVGARDLDPGERELLRANRVHVFTMTDIDRRGISAIMEEAIAVAGHNGRRIHLSLDLDALDPSEAPGVGTPVRGGLSYREAHLSMELLAACGQLCSLDVVEVNPILDRENATASLAVGLVLSALGKTIL